MPPTLDAAISSTAERVRLTIYGSFAASGHCASRADIAAELQLDAAEVGSAIDELQTRHHVVLGESGDIVMAHPFSSVNLGFSVMGHDTLWWGGCAWDSFAIPHLVPTEPSVLVATTCPACGTAHAWTVDRDAPPEGDQVAHFLVPAARIWHDVVHTCSNQRIFCSEACVDDWLYRSGNSRGSSFDLATLWRLAEHWYEGRLDTPYERRDPVAAAAYFASVGLHGPFWGTPEIAGAPARE
ncbi:organomercurial lyase [Subtercola sp. YIM 133946]|uniref:organomercurial lyase n=1 Tax=Subtercola sp. YIM 133946 TaxID=3118909 RepID=UPI002F9578D1